MGLLEIIMLMIFISWILGFSLSIGGSLIHLLLVIAVIIFLYDVITRRRL